MNQEQRVAFVCSHRTAIFGFNRKNDGPGMSVVYYVMDGNDILISTMEGRGKAKAVRRNSKVSLCVLDEHWPLTYLQVYGDATIEATVDTDLEKVVTLLTRIRNLMAGKDMPESVREQTRQMALDVAATSCLLSRGCCGPDTRPRATNALGVNTRHAYVVVWSI